MVAHANTYRYRRLTMPYGMPFVTNELGNRIIGATGWTHSDYRFRAPTTSTMTSFSMWFATTVDGDPGYGHGTLGIIHVKIVNDDGTANHWPNLSSVVSSSDIICTQTGSAPATNAGNALTNRLISVPWPTPVPLISNRIYHMILTNADTGGSAGTATNYCSVDMVCIFDVSMSTANTLPVMYGGGTDFTRLSYLSSSDGGSTWVFSPGSTGSSLHNHLPLIQMNFTDGTVYGLGYSGKSSTASRSVSGANMVRVNFTPSATQTFSFARCAFDGSGTPVCRLEDSGGTQIESGDMTSDSATYIAGDCQIQPYRFNFTQPRTLTSGSTYHLRFSAASGTLAAKGQSKANKHGFTAFSTAVAFPDGWAEFSTNTGSTWSDWDATHASDIVGFMLGKPGEL